VGGGGWVSQKLIGPTSKKNQARCYPKISSPFYGGKRDAMNQWGDFETILIDIFYYLYTL
jgi:hypothetical protein